MEITAGDIVIGDKSFATLFFRNTLNNWARNAAYYVSSNSEQRALSEEIRVVTSGANRIDLTQVITRDLDDVKSVETVTNTARWLISSYAHAQYVADNPQLFLPLLTEESSWVDVRHKGIVSRWSLDELTNVLGVTASFVQANLSDDVVVERSIDMSSSSSRKLMLMFTDKKLTREFIGDASQPVLQRAYYSAKRFNMFGIYTRTASLQDGERDIREGLNSLVRINLPAISNDAVKWTAYRDFIKIMNVYNVKPSIYDIRQQRQAVLNEQANGQRQDAVLRQQLAQKNFGTYWDTMKARVRSVVPDSTTSASQFADVPLQPQGTPSSRSWGIEVETVRAHMTDRPAGWESEYDGSLNGSDGGECDCECDNCYNGDHCDDRSDDCYHNHEGESREFVSPVLTSFNSAGLRQLCTDLPDDEDDTSPGIHVHVGASDLTVTDVARLLVAYSAVSPLLEPLYHRRTRSYCKEMATENLQWWLGAARKYLADTGRVPVPVDICHSQPADRYQDVNVQALSKHGTIEFRAMGPFYNYDHLVRWAWFVREMVNVSKLGLPQTTWTRCRSLTDVIGVLRKYGSEAPLDKQFDTINTTELQLSLSEE